MASNSSAGSKKPVRWRPFLFLVLLSIAALIWNWRFREVQRQDQNIDTARILIGTLLAILIWLLFVSRVRWFFRILTLLALISCIVLVAVLVEIKGVTGDLLPILGWKGKNESPREFVSKDKAQTLSVSNLTLANFPQFLGPNRDGTLSHPKLLQDWKRNPPKILWKRSVGAAWSGFAVSSRFAVTQEQRGENEVVACYDLYSGEPLWRQSDRAHYKTTIAGEGPRATPTIHGNRVYTSGATGILKCLDLESGRLFWSKNILLENKSSIPDWGFSGSPLVLSNVVIVSPGGGQGRTLAAYEAETGVLRWAAGEDKGSYSSPLSGRLCGHEQIINFNSSSVAGHDLDSGLLLWSYPWPKGHPHVAVPLVLSEDRLLVTSGYGIGTELLRLEKTPERWMVERLWKSNRLKSKFANLIVFQKHAYGLDDGILACIDLSTGELKWKEGRYGHGQMILVKDLILLMGENGDLILLEPNPNGLKEFARFSVFSKKTWNPPAMAGEFMLVRNDEEAACLHLPVLR